MVWEDGGGNPASYPILRFKFDGTFETGDDLHVVTCRKQCGVYTIGVFNNTFKPLPFSLVSHCGPIESIRELPVDASERGAMGHLPPEINPASIGENGPNTIAGGDVRIFEVCLKEELAEELPHATPPPRPQGRILPLRKAYSIEEEILARPTFFAHFDGVLIDWRYLHKRNVECVKREAGWIGRQKLRIVVDLTSGINLYPDIRLVDNIAEDYAASMETIDDVLAKMKLIGAHDLVICSHPSPQKDPSPEQTAGDIDATIREICRRAALQDTTVYLRICPGKAPENLEAALQLIQRVGAKNLLLAPNVGLLAVSKPLSRRLAAEMRAKLGLWMAGSTAFDLAGRLWSVHKPIADCQSPQAWAKIFALAPEAPIVFDVIYKTKNAEYIDAVQIKQITSAD